MRISVYMAYSGIVQQRSLQGILARLRCANVFLAGRGVKHDEEHN
eukprot:SAG11_NODE_2709_length_3060_cov_2.574806_5_plen_44_part_01